VQLDSQKKWRRPHFGQGVVSLAYLHTKPSFSMAGPALLVPLLSGCAFEPELETLKIPTAPPQPFQDFGVPVPSSSALVAQPAVPAQSYGDMEAASRLSPGMQLASALGGRLGVMLLAVALLWRSRVCS